jgi:GNAT superfamily N-acetyltransferase
MPDFRDLIPRIKELNDTIVIRTADLNDGPGFVQLFNTYYKRKTSLEYFKWQFISSPYESKLFAAFDGTRLVGFYGIKLYPLTNGLLTGFAIDFLIDESCRKKGIGYLLEAEVEDFCRIRNVSVLTALPNGSGNAAFKAFGWQSVSKIDTLVKGLPIATGMIDPVDKAYSEEGHYIEYAKSKEFREWRYNAHPAYKYEYVTVDKDNFAVAKLFANPFDKKNYQDIVEISYSSPENLAKILEKVFREATDKNVDSITIWALPHTTLFRSLVQQGFTSLPQERFFCMKMLDEKMEPLYDLKKWNLAEIDAEIY